MRSQEAKERFRHARNLYVDRQFEDALAELDALKDVYDAYPDLHYLRARCLGKLKRAHELRAVADLLTTRFNDPRGAEIHTWFVHRPVAMKTLHDSPMQSQPPEHSAPVLPTQIAPVETPTEPAKYLETTPAEATDPVTPLEPTRAGITEPPVDATARPEIEMEIPKPVLADTTVSEDPGPIPVPDEDVPVVAAFFETPENESAVPVFDAEPESPAPEPIPEIRFDDPVPAVQNDPNAQPTGTTPPKSKPNRTRRLALAACGLAAAAAGAYFISQNLGRAPGGSDATPTPRSSSTVMAAALSDPSVDIATAALVDAPATLNVRAEPPPVVSLPQDPISAPMHSIRFAPGASGGYAVEPSGTLPELADRVLLEPGRAVRTGAIPAWKVSFPFPFSFGGVQWESCFVNATGCLTFGYAESDALSERTTDGDYDMQALASAIDARAAAGRERMIAPFWKYSKHHTTEIYSTISENSVTITWTGGDELSPAFHVTLFADNAIEFAYDDVDPKGGLSGVFPGIFWAGDAIGHADDPGDAGDPNVDITAIDIEDGPSVIQFTLTMAGGIPAAVSAGELIHRITLDTSEGPRQFGVTVTNEPRGWKDWGGHPRTIGYERERERLYMYVSKSSLANLEVYTVHAEVEWKGYIDLFDRIDDPLQVDFTTALRSTDTYTPKNKQIVLGGAYRVFDGG